MSLSYGGGDDAWESYEQVKTNYNEYREIVGSKS